MGPAFRADLLRAVILAALIGGAGAPARAQTADPVLVSRGGAGSDTARAAAPSLSADGRYVAFWSDAPDLAPGDANGAADVFVHDRVTGTTRLVSTSAAGVQGTLASVSPVISADGRMVVFESLAGNLTGDADGVRVLMRKDLVTGALTRVSPASLPGLTNLSASQAALSRDGQRIAFALQARTTTGGAVATILVRDLAAGTLTYAARSFEGVAADGFAFTPSISGDGNLVAFHAYATNLGATPTVLPNVFVKNLTTGSVKPVARVSTIGAFADGASYNPAISADGTKVVFESLATNLASVPRGSRNYYRVDLDSGAIDLVNRDAAGAPGYDPVAQGQFRHTSALSADGSRIAFETLAANLGAVDANAAPDVYLKDMATGAVQALACADAATGLAPLGSAAPAVSATGAIAAFETASVLRPGGPPGGGVYVTAGGTCPARPAPVLATGWWVTPAEPGRGLFIEIRPATGRLFLGLAGYDAAGASTWQTALLSPDPSNPRLFAGTLTETRGPPGFAARDLGPVTILADDAAHGRLALGAGIGGRTLALARYAADPDLLPPDPRLALDPGWYWDPDQGGTGVAIDVQGQTIYLATLSYRADRSPVWTAILGGASPGLFAGTAYEVAGGPSLLSGPRGPLTVSNPTALTLDAWGAGTARLALGGATYALRRFTGF